MPDLAPRLLIHVETSKLPVVKNHRRATSVLLDSNIWRYLVAEGNALELAKIARRLRLEIQVAPAVVFEALRTGDPVLRRQLVSAMTLKAWRRLLPEAYEEASEVLGELRRLRPSWIHGGTEPEVIKRLRFDWLRSSGGWWDRAAKDTAAEAGRISALGDDTLERARAHALNSRERALEAKLSFDGIQLLRARVRYGVPTPGWDGEEVEPWRVAGHAVFTRALLEIEEGAYCDWLGPFLDLEAIRASRSSWLRFWLYEADSKRLPRCWLRWAFEHLQMFRKVSDGTPCDAQLGTYLMTCEHFVSADRIMVSIADKVSDAGHVAMARNWSVPGQHASQALFDLLAEIAQSRAGGVSLPSV